MKIPAGLYAESGTAPLNKKEGAKALRACTSHDKQKQCVQSEKATQDSGILPWNSRCKARSCPWTYSEKDQQYTTNYECTIQTVAVVMEPYSS